MGEVKDKILKALKSNVGNFVSGEDLGAEFGISRSAIWKHIQELQGEGYDIGSSTKKGYSLKEMPDILSPSAIKEGLETDLIGKDIVYLKEIPSTYDNPKDLAKDGAPEGTVIIAEVQKKGKGRMGREWVSPKGGIWMSLILRPKIEPSEAQKITLLAGIAMARVLNRSFVDTAIKWPNDIYTDGKKVAGILTEMEAEMDSVNFVVVGIGINANVDIDHEFPRELRNGATSIMVQMGEKVDRVVLVRAILEELEHVYLDFTKGGFPELLEEWKDLTSTIGRRVKIMKAKEPLVGEAVGITKEGALIVEKDDGTMEKVIAGECVHLR
jgi:BirA family biotin operon repressor/biotin-[acetyl-CoA-carboxylase] ligase